MAEDVGGIVWTADINTQGLTSAERRVNRSTRNISGNLERAEQSADRVGFAVRRMAAAVTAALSVRQVVAYADAWTNVQNQLKVVTDGSEELADVSQRIVDISRDTRASLEGTAQLFSRFRRGVSDTVATDEELLGVTKTINQALAVSGASAAEAEGVLRQLAQGLASGALRGEEFNSVAEQAPGILRAVSLETGKSVGDLREFAATGGITSELLITSLQNYAEAADREFNSATRSMSGALQVARTNAIEFVGQTNALTSAVGLAGDGVVFLSENLGTLINVVGAGVAIFGARFVGAIAQTTFEYIKLTAATAAQTAAQIQGNAATKAGVLALRGLRGALAFLGGPAGILFLVAAGFLTYASNAKSADQANIDLTQSTDALVKKFRELGDAQREEFLLNLTEQFNEARNKSDELRERVNKLKEDIRKRDSGEFAFAPAGLDEALVRAEAALERSDEKGNRLVQTLKKLRVAMREGGDAGEEAMDQVAQSATDAATPVRNVIDEIKHAQRLVDKGFAPGEDPFDVPDAPDDEPRDPGNIGLTDIEILESQFQREKEILEQSALKTEEIERRKTELQRQFSEQRKLLMEEEATGLVAQLERVGFSLDSLKNRAAGSLASVATGMQSGEDAAKSFARTMLTDLIGALIRIGIQSVATTLLASSAEQTAKATSAATTAASLAASTAATTAAAATASAVWAPAATLASIATLGGAAGIGTAAVAGALASGQALAAASQATSAVAGAASGAVGGGRLNGGPVEPGKLFPVTEDGRPELLVQQGRQFLLPGARGEVVSNKEMNNREGDNITLGGITVNANESLTRERFVNLLFDSEPEVMKLIESAKARRGERF